MTESIKTPEQIAQEEAANKAAAEKEQQEKEAAAIAEAKRIAEEEAANKAAAEKEQQEKEAAAIAEAKRIAEEEAANKAAEVPVNEFGVEVGKELSFAEVLQMQRKMEAKHGPAEAPAGQPVKTQLKRARGG